MSRVYESLKEVVTLQRNKNDPVDLPGGKTHASSSLDGEIGELVQKVSTFKAAVKQREEEIRKETRQVIQTLTEDFVMLEAKLKDVEETASRKESVSQKTEERLVAENHALQNELNTAKETLNNRDNEINDLKSNRDILAEQVTRLELVIQQVKAEAASEAQHAEQVIEGLKAKIATLQAQLTQTEQIVVGTDCTVTGLGKDRDRQVINLNAELKFPTNGTKEMAGVTSVVTEAPRKTVSQDAFARMTAEFSELTNVMGSIAFLIVRDHVKALGESMEEFPQTRLTELLDSLSGQITDAKLKAEFRERFTKV